MVNNMTTGNRIIAWNGHVADEVGFIWCMVTENVAGYQPMTGSDPLQAPWYLAHFNQHKLPNGSIDYKAAAQYANKIAIKYNSEQGITPDEARLIMASSFILGFHEESEEE